MNACGCSFGRGHWSCPLAGTRDSLWWWSRRSRGASRSSHRPTVASQRWSRTAGAGSCSRPGTPPASRKPCEPSARPKPRGGWAGTPERSTSDATRRSGTSIGSWASTPGRSRPPRRERRNEVRPVSAEADARPRSRWRIRQVVALGWTGLDQLLSSVSNVVVSLAVARAAGVDGLGAYTVAFALSLVSLGSQRPLTPEPLLAIPASEGPDGHPRRALGAVAMLAVGSATALVLGGLLSNRSELVALAAVIAFVCLQDAYRYVLFRRRRAHLAAVIDAVWLIASVAGWPLITSRGTATTAVLVWGIGAGLSALLGARIAGVLPSPGRAAIRWWSREARPLGGFLALTSIVYAVGGQVTVLGLATVLGEGALGELRAAQILFGPIALATTAISFFALPRLALAMGPILLLKARMTGKPLAGTRIITTLVGVPLVLVVASTQGLVAGVWAMLGQAAIYVWLVWRAAARSLRLVGTRPEPYAVLGVRIDPLGVEQAAEAFDRGHANGRARIVHQCNAYNLLLASKDPTYQTVMNRGDLNLPDGWPAVWAGRRLGVPVGERVAGADLCDAVFRRGIQTGLRHFFYGGTEATLERLLEHLPRNYPGIEIAGVYAPPFRPLTPSERGRITALVNGARPDVVWVGLGTPKQDYWMDEFRDRLDAGVLVGVGAVFDFLSGTRRRAPVWMQRSGLEWAHRLASEPGRLWRRYLLGNPEFALRFAGQLARERLRRNAPSGRVSS